MLRHCALLFLLLSSHTLADTLRIQGSNTIGAVLAPALARGLLEQQGVRNIELLPSDVVNEVRVQGIDSKGQPVRVEIAAHGSSTGFAALKNGSADLAAASRPIKDSDQSELQALGNLTSAEAEQVIALDLSLIHI